MKFYYEIIGTVRTMCNIINKKVSLKNKITFT